MEKKSESKVEQKKIVITFLTIDESDIQKFKKAFLKNFPKNLPKDLSKDLPNNLLGFDFILEPKFVAKEIEFADDLNNYDVCISPANSFGCLSGGFDFIYYSFLGKKTLQNHVNQIVKEQFEGFINIGQSCLVNLIDIKPENQKCKYLILSPTMTGPMNVANTKNAYYSMKSTIKILINMIEDKIPITNILCPLPCTGIGEMDPSESGKQCSLAFNELLKPLSSKKP